MSDGDDKAPTVHLEDGTPVKVRLVGYECEGDLSGEGHHGYKPKSSREEKPTVYFEEVSDGEQQ